MFLSDYGLNEELEGQKYFCMSRRKTSAQTGLVILGSEHVETSDDPLQSIIGVY